MLPFVPNDRPYPPPCRKARTRPVRKGGKVVVGIALDDRQSVPYAGVDAGLPQLDTASVGALLARQISEQRPVAAADIEDPRTRLDHVGNQPQVAPQLAGWRAS